MPNYLNYKSNLLIGFGLSLLILLISSAASFVSIQKLLESAELVNHTHRTKIEAEYILSSLREAESGQRGYLLTQDPRYMEHYEVAKTRTHDALTRLTELIRDNPVHQESGEQLKSAVEARLSMLNEVIAIRTDSGTINVDKLDEGRRYMELAREALETLKAREQELLLTRIGKMNTFATYTPLLIIIAALIALVITTLFYLRIKNDLNHRVELQMELEEKDRETSARIEIIRKIADKISGGDYAIRVDDRQGDALGSLALSLNAMAASLQRSFEILADKEWLQAGLAGLNELVIGEKTLGSISRDAIDFICTYVEAQVGAIYLLEQDQLQRTAAYAYPHEQEKRLIKLGEGLIGQAVASGKTIEWKDIPDGAIYIKFIAGDLQPRHVLGIPVYDGLNIKGGIEIASIHGFSHREIEFLTGCVHSIGVAIGAAQSRKHLQDLLEETQSQAEELQAQHNELENMNSELEAQSEKLQASEEELKAQQEELLQANLDLEEKAQQLEEKNELITRHSLEIQNKAEELAQSARYKSEFLANMSHELRTPLNSILLLSRLMSENNEHNLTPDQVEYARVIEVSGRGLLTLIDEILDLSKIESGKMELDYTQVPVADLVAEIEALFLPMAREKGLEFNTQIAVDVPEYLETDRLRLEQIIRNLLSNALKFTSQGYVSLRIYAADAQEKLCLAVKDTGIGISRDKHQLIFEAFQQADGSTQRKYGGTGLGLSICKELVKLLGGDISVNSDLNKGAEFTVCLPLRRQYPAPQQVQLNRMQQTIPVEPVAATAQTVVAKQEVPEKPEAITNKYLSPVIPESIPDDRSCVDRNDKVILIIEDDILFAKSLLEYTRNCGYKGIVAVRGDEGVELAKRYLPVGILLDIQLPIKSGWEVMDELKSAPATRHIPVHIMSSFEVKKQSLLQGAVDFINKPIAYEKMQEVFNRIEYVLTHHPKKVLIIEENSKHAQALAYFLRTYDVRLDVQHKVDEAIKALRDDKVDCVVLDMGVPNQISYDTLDQIKQTPGFENLPIIVFTGNSLSPKEELKIKQYADSIVVKTANSYQRILDEVSLFLHLMENREESGKPRSLQAKLRSADEILKGKTVLIADDDARNIFSLSKALEKFQIKVITAVDGRDAINQLESNPGVDIILMDMMMPEMDGYESMAVIHRDARYNHIPIIAVTAKAMVGDREKCIKAGASDYITKPVDVDQLLSLLRVWLYERG